MDGVLFPAEHRVILRDVRRQREMRRLKQGREMGAGGRKNRLPRPGLVRRAPASADAQPQIRKGVQVQQIGDGTIRAAQGPSANRSQLE